ncbi:MAG TPA: class I SAM-dependent methyltransferase [Aldersonia sp.]
MDAADWDRRYADADLIWGAPPNQFVVEMCWSLPPRRALDLACGEGRNAIWLGERGWEVTALDFSQVALDKGRTVASRASRSVRGRITWHRADVVTEDLGTDTFDLIVIAYLHLPADERRTVLRHVVRALAPRGVLVLVGHDTTNIAQGFGGPQDPAILYTPDDIVSDITDHEATTANLGDAMRVRVAEQRRRLTEAQDAIDALVVAEKAAADPGVVHVDAVNADAVNVDAVDVDTVDVDTVDTDSAAGPAH